MFSEILKIIPILDPARTKQMEKSLSGRFLSISKKFGKALGAAVKGTIIGISLGLLSKLLNPIGELEDKIKSLLNQGQDLKDMADEFNTDAGALKRLQDVAATQGVSPEQLKDMLSKFQEAQQTAQEELRNPNNPQSASTVAIRDFANEKDTVRALIDFLNSLKQVQGAKIIRGGQEVQLNQQQTQEEIQKNVFGQRFFGAQKRLANANLDQVAKQLNEPSAQTWNPIVDKLANLDAQRRMMEVRSDNSAFITGANNINGATIKAMEERAKKEKMDEANKIAAYQNLAAAANGIQVLIDLLKPIQEGVLKIVGWLGNLVGVITKGDLKGSMMRSLLKPILGEPPQPGK